MGCHKTPFFSGLYVVSSSSMADLRHVCNIVRQEVRDRFSGAMEAFTRRNGSSSGLNGDHHSRHRPSEDVPSSKDVVCKNRLSLSLPIMLYFFSSSISFSLCAFVTNFGIHKFTHLLVESPASWFRKRTGF